MKKLILLSIISIIIAAIMLRMFRPLDTIEMGGRSFVYES